MCVLALIAQPVHGQPARTDPAAPTASAPPETTPLKTAPPQPAASRPWAAGVSASEQAVALELYAAGNREFTESRFTQALAKYKEALRHWDHPAIRFNVAVCLINLDQPLEAHENLEHSVAYGEPPLGSNAYEQALIYRKLLAGQLGRLTIRCQQPGMQVSVDGKPLFTGPGTVDRFVLPGEHQVIATKTGFLTDSKTLIAVAGKVSSYEVHSIAIAAAPRLVRRWSVWLPWAVLAGGGALAAGGTWSYTAAARNIDRFDHLVAVNCAMRCSAETLATYPALQRYQDRSHAEQVAAFSLFAVGGAAVFGGVVGLILNQPRVASDVRVQPMVTPAIGGAAVSVRGTF